MMFGRVLCLFNRHRPRRDKITWDGFNYNSECTHCGKRIYRRQGGGWRAVRVLLIEGESTQGH